MPKAILTLFIIFTMTVSPVMAYQSLQELYELAQPQGEYDKYIELDPFTEYLGDLRVLQDESVRLIGNGAIIHGRPYNMSISVIFGRLDISGCVLVDGGYGIYYSTLSSGNIFCNTVAGCTEYGISTVYQDVTEGVNIWDNIVTDCRYGFYCVDTYHPNYLGYNTIWNITIYRYAEFCPD